MPGKLVIAIGAMLLAANGAAAQVPTAAATVAELSNSACYALASGAVAMPAGPDALDRTIKTVESFGLSFGVPNDATAQGPAVTTLISRATLGSKTLPDGQILFADGGAAGCRIILLADPRPDLTDAVAAGLAAGGWRAIPEMTATRGTIERRAFLRRDKAGTPYLLNLMTVIGQPGRLRLFTTVARIPPNVTLPAGY
ncbi:hypothetical protein E5A73_13200 [Sphingomonas gei]|uniref:Uncharacterized protein n=1 Tax=Sphingomonas gei TaxID=1395960 RepID=A0A4S1XAU8_9SPHN|nr:hypothetical protein [Sphingomonas gei]TGX52607.1 hypothetical protein E5A73_13200 [Sphingomonas gei]